MKKTVLIIEDNPQIAELVKMHLQDINCLADICVDGQQGLVQFQQKSYALIILDLMLPSLDGLEVCKRIRESNRLIPIIMLTSKTSELDRVLGLEIGADDYIAKPFSIPELLARIKAQFRRSELLQTPAEEAHKLSLSELEIDVNKRQALLRGQALELTAKEFDLLYHFASHPGHVYSRIDLLNHVWGYSYEGYEHTVNSHINRLRAKLEQNPAQPEFILTVWGVGYKFNEQKK